jgi:hypothetical protein
MTAGIEGISALWARRPLCSRADGVAFGAQGWVRGAGTADEAWVAIVLGERHTGRSRLVGAAFALSPRQTMTRIPEPMMISYQ